MSENEWMISAPGGAGSEGSVGGVRVAWKGTGGERGVASSFLFFLFFPGGFGSVL